jgi:hypothetical protein
MEKRKESSLTILLILTNSFLLFSNIWGAEKEHVFGLDVSNWGDEWHQFDITHSPDEISGCEECLSRIIVCKDCNFKNFITIGLLKLNKQIFCLECKEEIYLFEEEISKKPSKTKKISDDNFDFKDGPPPPQIIITCASCEIEETLEGNMLEPSRIVLCSNCKEKIKTPSKKKDL